LRDPLEVRPDDLLDMLVADVLAANPASARVFIERRMGCVGCTFGPFDTVTEAARAYGIEPGDLARSLADAHRPLPGTHEGLSR
jgi:hybrid cluster-associated redox disulfide protein